MNTYMVTLQLTPKMGQVVHIINSWVLNNCWKKKPMFGSWGSYIEEERDFTFVLF